MLLLLLAACFNDCAYFEACDGDTLLVCGEGVDQQFNRKVNPVPCTAPNEVCVPTSDQHATCAADATPCAEGDAASCDGDVLLACVNVLLTYEVSDGSEADNVWLFQGTDCAAAGQVCGVDDSGAAACVDA